MRTTAALCAGVGGLELALSQFGIETAWYAEVDPDASTVLEKRLEGVPNLGDIRDRGTWRTAPVPDILTAGFPCQPISQAGRQRHRDDERYLWPAVRDAVADLMPRTVFLENVSRITTVDRGSVLAEVLGDLYALGYAARWTVLGACAVLLSHHRHRWFLRAERVESGLVPAAEQEPAECGAPARRHKLLPTPIATDGQGGPREVPAARTHSGSDHGPRLRDLAGMRLLPTPTAKLGDARRGSPSPEVGARRLASGRSNLDDAIASTRLLPTPTVGDSRNSRNATAGRSEGAKFSTGTTLSDVAFADWWGQYTWAVQRQIDTTGVLPPEPTEPNSAGSQRLAPRFPEWMMAFPAGWVTDLLDRVPALRCIGNGASPIQAAAAWQLLAGDQA